MLADHPAHTRRCETPCVATSHVGAGPPTVGGSHCSLPRHATDAAGPPQNKRRIRANPRDPRRPPLPPSRARSAARILWTPSTQGGFKRSSQHLDSEELRWVRASVDGLIVRGVRRCVHRGVRRWDGANIGSGSGKRSLAGCRARMPARRPACLRPSEHVGSVKVVACPRSASPRCQGATCRLSSERRSRSFAPAATWRRR